METVGPLSLAIAINGEPVGFNYNDCNTCRSEQFFNVASAVYLNVPCGCCSQISVQNISDIPVTFKMQI